MTTEPLPQLRTAAERYAEILAELGINLTHPDLHDTPARALRALQELAGGPSDGKSAADHLSVTFEQVWAHPPGPIISAGIPFASVCEHHLLPVQGTADVLYLPDARPHPVAGYAGQVVGLSKLARAVRALAARPHMQERLTADIADAVHSCLNAAGVVVVVHAVHSCQQLRGARAAGTMLTCETRGLYSHHLPERTHALTLLDRARRTP